jgi:outer membrane protein TolC
MQEKIIENFISPATDLSGKNGNKFNLFLLISKYFYLFLFISKYFYLFLFLFLFSFLPIYSQSDSLLKYLEIAARKNPVVLQKFTEYQIALQKIPQVGSLSDPEFSFGIFLKPMELMNGRQIADISLMQMFPWFGVLRNGRDEMSLMANAKFELFRDAKLKVFYDVQATWYELYKIQKEIDISEKNIEILKTIERLSLVKFKSASSGFTGSGSPDAEALLSNGQTSVPGSQVMQGMATSQVNSGSATTNQSSSPMQSSSMGTSSGNTGLADLYRIQIESGDLQYNITLLKNRKQTVTALFNSFLNRPPATHVFTDEEIAADSLGYELIAVSDSILLKNPMLTMLLLEKKSVESRIKMVTAMGLPMVGLGLNYSLIGKDEMSGSSMNGKDMIMPMVTVTLPIYRKKYNAMKNEAELMGMSVSQNYQNTVNELVTEYYQAVQLYNDSKQRVKLYNNQYQLASKSLNLMMKSFSNSSSGLTDVLRIQQQALDYELKQVEAVADLNISIAWLRRLGNMEIR